MTNADSLDELVKDHGTPSAAAALAQLRQRAALADRLEQEAQQIEPEPEQAEGPSPLAALALGAMLARQAGEQPDPARAAFVRDAEMKQAAYAATRRALAAGRGPIRPPVSVSEVSKVAAGEPGPKP